MQLSQYNTMGVPDRFCEKVMENLLASLKASYDYIIIDCGLQHELLTVNAFPGSNDRLHLLRLFSGRMNGLCNHAGDIFLRQPFIAGGQALGVVLRLAVLNIELQHRVLDGLAGFRPQGGDVGDALEGAKVTITPDCCPCRGTVKEIQVSMTKQTWSGVVTLNRRISAEVGPEAIDVAIIRTIGEMAENIEIPHNWKG